MATLIDSLVVTLGLDPKGFKQGEREAGQAQRRMREDAVRTQKEIEEVGKRVTSALNSARNAAIGLFAVFIGGRGISNFVRETSEGSAALGRLSRDLGITTERLSAWEGVSRRVGNSANEITGAFQNIQDRIQQARLLNNPSAVAGFMNARIALADGPNGERPRTTEAIYEDVLRYIARAPREERLTRAQSMGFGQETVNLALAPNRAQMLREQAPTAVTAEQVRNLTSLREAMLRFNEAVEASAREILSAFAPAITAVLNRLREFALYMGSDQFRPVIENARRAFEEFANYLTSPEFINDLRLFKDSIAQLTEKLVQALRWLGLIPDPYAPTPQEQELQRRYPLPGPSSLRDAARERIPSLPGGAANQPTTLPDAQRRMVEAYLADTDRRLGLPTGWSAGMIGAESNWNPNARSPAGAVGLAQVMPETQAALERRLGRTFDATNPRDAVEMHRLLMAENMQRFGNVEDASRAYNGGWDRDRWNNAETQAYVGRIRSRLPVEGPRRGPPPAPGASPLQRLRGEWERQLNGGPAPDPALTDSTRPGAAVQNKMWGGSSVSNETAINGPITVNTQATDANGIARDIGAALKRHAFVDQVTLGLA